MANIKGIELASEIYDLEDTSARNTATAASQTATQAGQTATQASQTATTANQTAEDAMAEARVARNEIGDISSLETTEKTDLVSAINELVTSKSKVIIKKGTIERSNIPAGWDAFYVKFSEPFPNDNIIVMVQPPENNYVMTVAISGVVKSEFRVTLNSRDSGNGIFNWTAICIA